LHEEQAQAEAIERRLLETEDQHLLEKAKAAFKAKDYSVAAAHVTARMELRLSSGGIHGRV
jgi:hypothetical protein